MDKQEESDEIPGELTREELEAKLKEVQERLARYLEYGNHILCGKRQSIIPK